ncbi:VQ motif-containing protein 10 [Rhodamnia argentea]|uniref:VQ motif-containing protein 10 n=1 Tax=Rhodamnia argentea TaxID=178133 RepID=A0A8B8NT23_9MYRT|nr:VQ motif-containing protein 10 [Rhodamnia argentea]
MTDQKGQEGIKVVIINTQYVQTDPKSFKSVVQKLTGKDSKVPGSPDAKSCTAGTGGARSGVGDIGGMSRNLPFKYDLDRMLKEMPPVREFNDLWSN